MEPIAAEEGRKPFLLVGSALTSIFVVGVVALVISLAVSIRPTVDQRPSPGPNAIVPSTVAPAPAPVQEAQQPVAPPPPRRGDHQAAGARACRKRRAPRHGRYSSSRRRAPQAPAPAPAPAAPPPAPEAPPPAPIPVAPAPVPYIPAPVYNPPVYNPYLPPPVYYPRPKPWTPPWQHQPEPQEPPQQDPPDDPPPRQMARIRRGLGSRVVPVTRTRRVRWIHGSGGSAGPVAAAEARRMLPDLLRRRSGRH